MKRNKQTMEMETETELKIHIETGTKTDMETAKKAKDESRFKYDITLLKEVFKQLSLEAIEEYFSPVGLGIVSLVDKEFSLIVSKKRGKRDKTKAVSIYTQCFRFGYLELAFKLKKEDCFAWDERRSPAKELSVFFSYDGGNTKSVELILKEFFPFKYKVIGNIEFVKENKKEFYLFSPDHLQKCFRDLDNPDPTFRGNLFRNNIEEKISEALFFAALENRNISEIENAILSLAEKYMRLFDPYLITKISNCVCAGYALSDNEKSFFHFWEKFISKFPHPPGSYFMPYIQNLLICAVLGGNQTIFDCVYTKFSPLSNVETNGICQIIYDSGNWDIHKNTNLRHEMRYKFDVHFLFYAPFQKNLQGIEIIGKDIFWEESFPIQIVDKDKPLYKEFYQTIKLELVVCILEFTKSVSLESIIRILFLDNPQKIEIVEALLSFVEKYCSRCLKRGKGSKKWIPKIRELFPVFAKRIEDLLYPDILL